MRAFLPTLLLAFATLATHAQSLTPQQRERVDHCLAQCETDSTWLLSRLQMYWHSHATDVYIDGESFHHAGGKRAPYPTVKLDGTRGTASQYNRPRLDDIVPYDDDAESHVTYISRATQQAEPAHPSKTGRNISNVNREILQIARDAARLYRETSDSRYARLVALPVLRTFLRGLLHRNIPYDLNHGHQQTLVGMTAFEVIHEDVIIEATEAFRLLADEMTDDERRDCEDALRKWADCIAANGVPHNNWDIIQANFIADVALSLRDDTCYADRRGRQHYLALVTHHDSLRQWSMKRLAAYGFDPATAIWTESPGYSTMTVGEFCALANRLDREANIDLFDSIPTLIAAVRRLPQYLFPNRMIAGFGDTHPNYLGTKAIDEVIDYARRHDNDALLRDMQSLRQAVQPLAPDADIEAHTSALFHAPAVSWLALRSGMNPRNDLMLSLNASLGNHQHANGISLELYGKGYVLAPDAGIGRMLYSGLDYAEYYSQMPAHNTVCVNGVSSYPVMQSHHAFRLLSAHATDTTAYANVAFTEPETQAHQMRTVGLVKTSAQGGYYVDIFRSTTQPVDGLSAQKSKTAAAQTADCPTEFHDYFYHNLGQTMTLTAADGSDLSLAPTDELAFAGGCLYAYSYLYDKQSATTAHDIRARFRTETHDGRTIDMTMWMGGAPNRQIFRALSPVNLEYERMPNQPYRIDQQPVLTYVARHTGEAWSHPFVAIFEPSDNEAPSDIASVEFFRPKSKNSSAVGIKILLRSGRTDYIFSAPSPCRMSHEGIRVNTDFAIISR